MIRYGQPKVGRVDNDSTVGHIVAEASNGAKEIATLKALVVSLNAEVASLTSQLEECQNAPKAKKKK